MGPGPQSQSKVPAGAVFTCTLPPLIEVHVPSHPVRLGCCNKNTVKNNLFLIVLEAAKPKIKVKADLASGEDHFVVHRQLSPCGVLTGQKERESSLFLRALIPFMRTPP